LSCDQQLTNPAANNSRATYGFFSPPATHIGFLRLSCWTLIKEKTYFERKGQSNALWLKKSFM
jgi:hypothetical protein